MASDQRSSVAIRRAPLPASVCAAADRVPRVSAVLVNWNRLEDVRAAVRSLRNADYDQTHLEIIVVDNGSTDGSAEALSREPGVRMIRLKSNVGPSAARNAGIRVATGKYILLLDSDALMGRFGLQKVIEHMERQRDIAIAGLRILSARTGEIDQWIYAQSPRTHSRKAFDTYSFSAAGAVLRHSAVRATGGFWEKLFIYNEEVDLSIRAMRLGYRVVYLPTGCVFHRPSERGRADASKYFRLQIRNWIWIFFRHYPAPIRWWLIALYSAMYVVKGAANGQTLACVQGIAEGLGGQRKLHRYRRKLSFAQAQTIRSLNRRYHLRLRDLATRPLRDNRADSAESTAEIEDPDVMPLAH